VDSVRACALGNAIEVAGAIFTRAALEDAVIKGWIISLAREFEAYLDPSVARPPGHGPAPDDPEGR
jgi:hypothetical protein